MTGNDDLEEIDQDPTRYLVLGPDRAGNLLEAEAMRPASGQRVRASWALR